MATLYIRDVPDGVAETLKARAAAQGQSLSGCVKAQLRIIAARPTNAEIVARLRSRSRAGGASAGQIRDAIDASRRRSSPMPPRWWKPSPATLLK